MVILINPVVTRTHPDVTATSGGCHGGIRRMSRWHPDVTATSAGCHGDIRMPLWHPDTFFTEADGFVTEVDGFVTVRLAATNPSGWPCNNCSLSQTHPDVTVTSGCHSDIRMDLCSIWLLSQTQPDGLVTIAHCHKPIRMSRWHPDEYVSFAYYHKPIRMAFWQFLTVTNPSGWPFDNCSLSQTHPDGHVTIAHCHKPIRMAMW